ASDLLDQRPTMTFPELRGKFLPDYDSRLQQRSLRLLQYSYWSRRCRLAIDMKSSLVKLEDASPATVSPRGIFAPLFPFLERAGGVGCVNARPDDDGVMRRPW